MGGIAGRDGKNRILESIFFETVARVEALEKPKPEAKSKAKK